MKFLKKLFFFDPLKTGSKRELYIHSNCIDFLTWHKGGTATEGTMIHTNLSRTGDKFNHIVEGIPESVNQIAFDGIFFKATSHYCATDGMMKKFTIWINPENIASIYSEMPDDCKIFFDSGINVIIVNKMQDVLKGLFEHNKKIKERKKLNYGK